MQGGRKGELNLGKLLAKRGHRDATGLRGRPGPAAGKAEIVAAVATAVAADRGRRGCSRWCTPSCPSPTPRAAHELLDSPDTVGKVILTIRGTDASPRPPLSRRPM